MTDDSLRLGAEAGWALAPIVDWLFRDGRRCTEPGPFLQVLGNRLAAAGAPIMAMRFALDTIDPLVLLWGFAWRRAQPDRASETRVGHGLQGSDAYINSPVQKVHQTGRLVRRRLNDLDPERDHPVYFDWLARGAVDHMVLPMHFSNGAINVLIVVSDRAGGFSDADIEKFSRLVDFLVPVLEVMATRRTAITLLNTYVGPRTADKILHGLFKRGDGETLIAAIWFSDLRDFAAHSEALPTARILAMLNAYFECVAAATTARGGELLKFIGDATMIVFPAETEQGLKSACAAALDAAVDTFASLAVLNHQRQRAGEPAIRFGIGLHVGEVVYGNVGAPDRLDFTVMGPAVNRTARLEALTKDLGEPLVCSKDFIECLGQAARPLGEFHLKGIAEPLQVFAPPVVQDA